MNVSHAGVEDAKMLTGAEIDKMLGHMKCGFSANVTGLEAAYRLAEVAGIEAIPALVTTLLDQAALMQADMEAWVPYSFKPVYNFHIPLVVQRCLMFSLRIDTNISHADCGCVYL